ncbi:putative transcription factor WD40-like family [Helianthus debilis subsp. tardiflorus]
MKPIYLIILSVFITINSISAAPATTIIFTTNGRSRYAFDIFSLPLDTTGHELQLTDGHSVNFNGHFVSSVNSNINTVTDPDPSSVKLIYVTERNGTSSIYLDEVSVSVSYPALDRTRKRSVIETESTRSQHRLVGGNGRVSMKDRPSLVGDLLIYVSTHEDTGVARTSWAAVYSTQLSSGLTRRLTPEKVADFSPAVSPSGLWTAVASSGEKGWGGEVEELDTDIYVFLTQNGLDRVKVVEHGGWPSWVDDSTFYFHRRVATRRPNSDYRHIELYDVVSGKFKDLTRLVAPKANHYNPFISPDSSWVGYHKCRGAGSNGKMIKNDLFLESIKTEVPDISLFRIDGSFPSFSPDGSRIAYVGLPGLYLINSDGSGNRVIDPDVSAFPTVWDPKRKGVIYTSLGPTFASEDTSVDIYSVEVDVDEPRFTKLTIDGLNNAFPAVSPDGKWVAFRSGRTGHKNLYIMNAVEGEKGGLTQLTNGPWSDTMCNWSPDGDWIIFASDRHNPGSGSFGLYIIHPNGTGLRHLIHSGSAGRTNHPWFSPDGKRIVFTSDYAAVSAEPISNPHHYQPYGEIFTMKLDGSELTRLTHNSFEDGTPSWGPKFMKPENVEWSIDEEKCSFEDSEWLAISNRVDIDEAKIQCGG